MTTAEQLLWVLEYRVAKVSGHSPVHCAWRAGKAVEELRTAADHLPDGEEYDDAFDYLSAVTDI